MGDKDELERLRELRLRLVEMDFELPPCDKRHEQILRLTTKIKVLRKQVEEN